MSLPLLPGTRAGVGINGQILPGPERGPGWSPGPRWRAPGGAGATCLRCHVAVTTRLQFNTAQVIPSILGNSAFSNLRLRKKCRPKAEIPPFAEGDWNGSDLGS